MEGWRECTLEEVIELGNGKARPLTCGNIPVYGGNGILGYCDSANYPYGAIIIGRVGAYCGSIFFEEKPVWISDNALAAIPRKDNDARYIYYMLKHCELNEYAEGSGHPLLTQRLLKTIKIAIPCPKIQQAIAAVLSSLDDKIDLLHRQNKTLEALAQTLFRQWFVEEADGGWEEKEISSIADVCSGFAFKSEQFTDEGLYKLITIKAVQDGYLTLSGADTLNEIPIKMPSYCFLSAKDILLSLTGNVGRCCFVDVKDNLLLNQRVAIVIPKNKIYWEYLFTLFRSETMHANLEEMAKGTAQPNLSSVETSKMRIRIPSDALLTRFHAETFKNYDKILKNRLQLHTLTKLRDTLLPKLISGEIRVEV